MVGAWCEAQEVDAWLREAPHLVVSCAPAQDGASAGAVDGEHVVALTRGRDARGLRLARVPRRRRDALGRDRPPGAAGVRAARAAARRAACGSSRARGAGAARRPRGRGRRRDRGRARARGRRGRAVNAASGQLRGCATGSPSPPATSCCTEPVPDVIEALGWTGGEAITDGRALLHYFRTTRDGRILLGWGGGRMAAGARTGGRMDSTPTRRADASQPRCGSSRARGPPDRARLGRPDRRLPHPPARDRHAPGRPRVGGVRLHRQRRRARRTWRRARSPRSRSAAARPPRAGPGSTRRRRPCRPSRCGSRARR